MEPIWDSLWDAAADAMMAALVAGILVPFLPLTLVLAFIMAAGRRAWLRMLCKRYPTLHFEQRTRFTSTMDSARSQGTATALLMVRGIVSTEDLRTILQTRLLSSGARPHLRLALDWRLGRYAWRDPDAAFDVARHVLDAPATWRGRPVDTFNVQECVSAQAARRLPSGHSPWQVALFAVEEQTYVFVRAHLALLAADKLSLGELLPLDYASLASPPEMTLQPPTPPLLGEDDELPPPASKQITPVSGFSEESEGESMEKWENEILDPPLVPPLSAPFTALNILWSNFVSFFENIIQVVKTLDPALGGQHPRDPLRWTVALLVAATHIIMRAPGDPRGLRMKYLWAAPGDVFDALVCAVNPWLTLRMAMATAWRVVVWSAAVAPLLAAREAALVAAGRSRETAAGTAVNVTMLLGAAIVELGRLLFTAIRTPRSALRELQGAWSEPLSELQAASLCGRRAVAWSSPVSVSTLRRARASAASKSGQLPSVDEVALAALARALDAYFLLAALPQPAAVPATARSQTLAQALGHKAHHARTWTCVSLPTGVASEGWKQACDATARAVRTARKRATGLRAATEVVCRVATALLPSVALRMALNAITRRYAVSITFLREDREHREGEKKWKDRGKLLLAGCNVEEAFVWRPPQANISLSLTLVRGIRGLQLGALADAQLTPAPAFLAAVFQRELRSAAGESPPPIATNS